MSVLEFPTLYMDMHVLEVEKKGDCTVRLTAKTATADSPKEYEWSFTFYVFKNGVYSVLPLHENGAFVNFTSRLVRDIDFTQLKAGETYRRPIPKYWGKVVCSHIGKSAECRAAWPLFLYPPEKVLPILENFFGQKVDEESVMWHAEKFDGLLDSSGYFFVNLDLTRPALDEGE